MMLPTRIAPLSAGCARASCSRHEATSADVATTTAAVNALVALSRRIEIGMLDLRQMIWRAHLAGIAPGADNPSHATPSFSASDGHGAVVCARGPTRARGPRPSGP